MRISVIISFILFVVVPSLMTAQIPRTLSYQGVLLDNNGQERNGDFKITFSLYDSVDAADNIWSAEKTIKVEQGLFSAILGQQEPFGNHVKFDKPYYLGIKVEDEQELSPRIPLTSVGYSFRALRADTAIFALANIADTVAFAERVGTVENAKGGAIKGGLILDLRQRSGAYGREGLHIIASNDNNTGVLLVNKDTFTLWNTIRDEQAKLACKQVSAYNGFITSGFRVIGDNNLWMGSWDDHYIELADGTKRIRSTKNPDGAVIFYTHSHLINPRWEFRDLLNESLKASINGLSGDAFFNGQVSASVIQIRGGADLAEPFEISNSDSLSLGSLVVIDRDNP